MFSPILSGCILAFAQASSTVVIPSGDGSVVALALQRQLKIPVAILADESYGRFGRHEFQRDTLPNMLSRMGVDTARRFRLGPGGKSLGIRRPRLTMEQFLAGNAAVGGPGFGNQDPKQELTGGPVTLERLAARSRLGVQIHWFYANIRVHMAVDSIDSRTTWEAITQAVAGQLHHDGGRLKLRPYPKQLTEMLRRLPEPKTKLFSDAERKLLR